MSWTHDPSPKQHCLRLLAPLAVAASLALLCGCDNEDDASLWGDAMSPTDIQKADRGPGPAPTEMSTSEGDSDDPFVDNPNYPFVEQPWWSSPAYNGG